MKPRGRGSAGLAAAVSFAVALAAVGIAIEAVDPFPRLRFAIQRSLDDLPSTAVLDRRDVRPGHPTVSLSLEPEALKTLLDNKLEHGRDWERPAFLSFFENGRVVWGAHAGVRVHGGGSRLTSPTQSFRVFFRRDYGAARAPAGILLDSPYEPLRRLVIHNDARTDRSGLSWHLVNPLAYDFARRIGCITPYTKPVRFYVNGEYQGLYVLTEHFDDEYFEAHMPGRPITMPIEPMETLRSRIDETHPLTMEAAGELVDLENVTSWFLAVLFSATRDAYQGPGQFLDEARDRAPWFWVTWDLDQSFRTWDLDSFQYLLDRLGEPPRGRRASEPRPTLLTRLIAGDEQYRAYLARRIDDMLNHQLTQPFIDERANHYAHIATEYGARSLEYIPSLLHFLSKRRAFVRGISEQWLNRGPAFDLIVRAAGEGSLIIDGFEEASPYTGKYFPGREVTIRTAVGASLPWYVNGRQVATGTELRVTVDRPLAVTVGGQAEHASAPPPAPTPPPPPVATPLVWREIAGRTFDAGCVDRDRGCTPGELPRERIPLDGRYRLTATEITVGQFRAYAARAGLKTPRQPVWGGDLHPVVNVTWEEAAAFCSAHDGRLPTEGEWEFAARAGTETIYPWGNTFDPAYANGIGVPGPDQFTFTAPVGTHEPNAFGLHDMIGNLWEWTADWYREGEGWTTAPPAPPAPGSAGELRTVRGGSWDSAHENLRVSRRLGLSPRARHNLYVGFRCAQQAPAAAGR